MGIPFPLVAVGSHLVVADNRPVEVGILVVVGIPAAADSLLVAVGIHLAVAGSQAVGNPAEAGILVAAVDTLVAVHTACYILAHLAVEHQNPRAAGSHRPVADILHPDLDTLKKFCFLLIVRRNENG